VDQVGFVEEMNMRRNNRTGVASCALAAAVALLGIAAGCDSRPAVNSSTTEEGTVHGRVTLDGKPVTGGEVVFNPANYQRKMIAARTAPIGADGTYTITTLTGSNAVMVNPKADSRGKPKAGAVPAQMRPFEVQPGDNTFDVELSTPAPTAAR
jgi:hypothetical protein